MIRQSSEAMCRRSNSFGLFLQAPVFAHLILVVTYERFNVKPRKVLRILAPSPTIT